MRTKQMPNGVDQGVLMAVTAVVTAAQALMEAATHADDADACRVATAALSGSIEWIGSRGLDLPEKVPVRHAETRGTGEFLGREEAAPRGRRGGIRPVHGNGTRTNSNAG